MKNESEQNIKPEIYIQELLEIVDKIKFEYGEKINYNWTNFLLLLDTKEEAGLESPASFFYSTEIDGFDIYIKETLSLETRKRVLFHQILNANLLSQGLSLDEAHNIAKIEEEKIFDSRWKIMKNTQYKCFNLLN